MRKPSIHLNGSSAQSLFNGYRHAYEKMSEAIEAVQATAPHGRDYYVQEAYSPGRVSPTNEAMDEHRRRMALLETVKSELEELALHVMDEAESRGKAVVA